MPENQFTSRIVFLKLVNVYSSALRTCWTPSKSVRYKKITRKEDTLEILINLQTDLYPLNLLLYTKSRKILYNSINFLDGIGSIFITPPISLSPNCPPHLES
uniref:Putative ovule protein n=1 Tax=Solanum chacoense TaxID=4108 RepID=A0A0V0IUV0_SOLCH